MKQKNISQRFQPKAYMQATISMLCMFICGDEVNYSVAHLIFSKLSNFIISWKIIKNAIKICTGLFLHQGLFKLLFFFKACLKQRKICKKAGLKCHVHP